MAQTAGVATPTTFPLGRAGHRRFPSPPATAAALAYLAAALAVLVRAPRLLEPDDLAYRASIVALSRGQVTLSNAQYHALARSLAGGVAQWIHLADGRWMSEKNPGYPFLAVAFQWLGDSRLAPLCFGGVACVALYLGARRWIGAWGAACAVVLYVGSGAALAFMWRAYMPTFTDASLVAAGAGALLWTLLATERSSRQRALAGLAGFVALELATFTRYTDVVALVVGCVVVLAAARPARVPARTVAVWLGSVAAFAVADLAWNAHFYGGPLRTGYASGEVAFSLGSLPANLAHLTVPLVASMPLCVLAGAALVGIARRRPGPERTAGKRRDAAVAAGLGGLWLGSWGLYELYDWTAQMGTAGGDVHVVRFYLPALGALALLGAWALVRVPRTWAVGTLGALCVAGLVSFGSLTSAGAVGRGPLGPLQGPATGQLAPGPSSGGPR